MGCQVLDGETPRCYFRGQTNPFMSLSPEDLRGGQLLDSSDSLTALERIIGDRLAEVGPFFFAKLAQGMKDDDSSSVAALFGHFGNKPEETIRIGEHLFSALASLIVSTADYEQLASDLPEFASLKEFCRKTPPSIYDAIVLFNKMAGVRAEQERLLSSLSDLSSREEASLSIFNSLGTMEEALLPFLRRYQQENSRVAYDKEARVDLDWVLERTPSLHPFGGRGEKRRVSILDFIIRKAREKRVRVLDVGTGAGNVCLGLERVLPRKTLSMISIIASDVNPERFPEGWETEDFKNSHPCVKFGLIDAREIPDDIIRQVDLILINGVFNAVSETRGLWHRALIGVLTYMKPGAVCMITPCSMPPAGDPFGGEDFGIKMEDIDPRSIASLDLGKVGSPSFAIAEILNHSGCFRAATFLQRDFFAVGRYDTTPMTKEEAIFLGRFKEMVRGNKLNQLVQSLLYWMQTNALVFQKLESPRTIYPALAEGEIPQIFKPGILV